jgi:hypothetical protein
MTCKAMTEGEGVRSRAIILSCNRIINPLTLAFDPVFRAEEYPTWLDMNLEEK